MTKPIMKTKAALSMALLAVFFLVLITGLLLWMGDSSHSIKKLHTISGLLMGIIASPHILLNLKMLIGEITGKMEIRFR